MIRYALKCAEDHRFESWFQSADAYDTLAAGGHVACPICGGTEVEKAIMAPRVAGGDKAAAPAAPKPVGTRGDTSGDTPGAAPPERPLTGPAHPAEQMLRAMRAHLEKNSTYVGKRFASEARAMHVGDKPHGMIHGEASPEEARALLEDGVPVAPLPLPPGPGGKTN